MIQELVRSGPIYVCFTVYGDFPTYKSCVYKHISGSYRGGRAVTFVGYGELNGEKYREISLLEFEWRHRSDDDPEHVANCLELAGAFTS